MLQEGHKAGTEQVTKGAKAMVQIIAAIQSLAGDQDVHSNVDGHRRGRGLTEAQKIQGERVAVDIADLHLEDKGLARIASPRAPKQ